MANRAIILTLGFDEKFAIRALMRAAPLGGDEVIVIIPSTSDERSKKALDSLKNFCNTIGITIDVREVPVAKPEEAIATIYKVCSQKLKERRSLHFNLSGGMRALILETMAAALAVARQMPRIMSDTKVEIELENFSGVAEFTLSHFMLSLPGSLDLDILACIKESEASKRATLDIITSAAGIPRSTVYRRLLDLQERGYVRAERQGRRVVYSLTDLGRMWA
jgi:CRISPR-associated protein Csa3